jgi:hypothetical protein
MAERYGAEMSVPDWHKRLVCGNCGRRRVDFVVWAIAECAMSETAEARAEGRGNE